MIRKYRKELALILCSGNGPSYTEIASEAGVSYNTVKAAANTDIGVTTETMERISDALMSLDGNQTCEGCAYNQGEDPEFPLSTICAVAGCLTDGGGCGHWISEEAQRSVNA